jgi:hypothetical protein
MQIEDQEHHAVDLIATCFVGLKEAKIYLGFSLLKLLSYIQIFASILVIGSKKREKIGTGERFFKEQPNCMFDAMPAVRKNLSNEDRHACTEIIDGMKEAADSSVSIWSSRENIRNFLKIMYRWMRLQRLELVIWWQRSIQVL